jgi:dTMP kinase
VTTTGARGVLVAFEGAEGVGKTTQLVHLARRLADAGIPYQTFREPGGTPAGEQVRTILLDPVHEGHGLAAAAEALLFMASRAQLLHERIRPALDAGEVVLLDRFFLSTYAYQVIGRGLDESDVRAANRLATAGLVPDLTVVFDLPVADGLTRADRRGVRDRMEQAGDAFHARVGAAFATFVTPEWQAAHPEAGPIARVDAQGSEELVAARLVHLLAHQLPQIFSSLMPLELS